MNEFEEMHPRHLLMLRWLRHKKSLMSNSEKLLFELLISLKSLNDYQDYELRRMYDRIKAEDSAPIEFKPGIYCVEVSESCGMVG